MICRARLRPLVFLGSLLSLAGEAHGQSSYTLDFSEAVGQFVCAVEGRAKGFAVCYLSVQGKGAAAEGWSIGVRASDARISGIRVAGTAVDRAAPPDFVFNELTTGPGNEGVVSSVVLSRDGSVVLPPSRYEIAILEFERSAAGKGRLEYVDGLQSSIGTVLNMVRERGREVLPALRSQEFNLPLLPLRAWLGFSPINVDSKSPFGGIVGGMESVGDLFVPLRSDGKGGTHVFGCIVTNETEGDAGQRGIQGWSISMNLEGEAEILSATTDNTAGMKQFSGGFLRTTIVDPARNGGKRGITSAVVLSFGPHFLPLVRSSSLTEIQISVSIQIGQLHLESLGNPERTRQLEASPEG